MRESLDSQSYRVIKLQVVVKVEENELGLKRKARLSLADILMWVHALSATRDVFDDGEHGEERPSQHMTVGLEGGGSCECGIDKLIQNATHGARQT